MPEVAAFVQRQNGNPACDISSNGVRSQERRVPDRQSACRLAMIGSSGCSDQSLVAFTMMNTSGR
jgi:hypothetical protein